MQNERSDAVRSSVRQSAVTQGSPIAGSLQTAFMPPSLATPPTASTTPPVIHGEVRQRASRLRWILLGSIPLVLLLIGGVVFFIVQRLSNPPQTQTGNFGVVNLPLNSLATAGSTGATSTLRVNGQLQVTNSLVLAPTAQPTNGVAGQIYFDQTTSQLAYYNGQQFVPVGSTTTTITNVNNIVTGSETSVPAVQLQAASPGVQQTGNFNISGTGRVGSLETTIVNSSGAAFSINPSGTATSGSGGAGTPGTLGLTSIGTITSSTGHNSTILATKATMGTVAGTATSITVYIAAGTPGQRLQVALYDDDGDLPNRPSTLLATSAVTTFTPNAFNTIPIPATALAANATYWLAMNTEDTTLTRPYNPGNKNSCFYGLGFGFMPSPFGPGPCFFSNEEYTIYANFTSSGGSGSGFNQAQFSLSSSGQAAFQNSTDSPTAFQVQNAAGSTLFNIDTSNGRVAIGKANANYKLDIAGGDINLSTNRSIRFGGVQALTVNSSGGTTALSNFSAGGKVVAQADSFVVQDASGLHQNVVVDSDGGSTFSNRVNSANGFRVQNAASVNLLRADTAGMQVVIGNPAGDNAPVVLYLANKNTAGDPVGAEGGTYYNSTLGSFRCFRSGFWHNCADIEPQHGFSQYDEFIGGSTSFTGQIGSLGWNAIAIGANGSLALNPTTPTPSADRPGVLRLQTPAVANQGTTLMLGDSTGGSMLVAKDNNVKTALAVGALANQVVRVGLHNGTSSVTQPVSGVWWEADTAANANWRYCYGNGATATCTATAVAIAANAWVTLEIRVTATGSGTSAVTFVINNTPFTVSGVTIDTTGRVSPALTCYTTTGAARDCYLDYFQLTGTTSAGR